MNIELASMTKSSFFSSEDGEDSDGGLERRACDRKKPATTTQAPPAPTPETTLHPILPAVIPAQESILPTSPQPKKRGKPGPKSDEAKRVCEIARAKRAENTAERRRIKAEMQAKIKAVGKKGEKKDGGNPPAPVVVPAQEPQVSTSIPQLEPLPPKVIPAPSPPEPKKKKRSSKKKRPVESSSSESSSSSEDSSSDSSSDSEDEPPRRKRPPPAKRMGGWLPRPVVYY